MNDPDEFALSFQKSAFKLMMLLHGNWANLSNYKFCTPPDPSAICVMVESSSKNSTMAWNMLRCEVMWFLCTSWSYDDDTDITHWTIKK